MLEYRGYGLSTGTPNEEGLMVDAQTALDYIRQQKETRGGKIIIYGQSLGGAVAIQLVAKNQEAGDVAGLILENTFTTMSKLIPRLAFVVRISRHFAQISPLYSRTPRISPVFVINTGPVRIFYLESPAFLFFSSAG